MKEIWESGIVWRKRWLPALSSKQIVVRYLKKPSKLADGNGISIRKFSHRAFFYGWQIIL